MSLSKLSNECLDQIFFETVQVRSFRRAMRLRIVSRQFRDGITAAIYRTRFLERLVNSNVLLGPYNERRYPEWTSLLYSHLAQRIFRGPDVTCPKSRIRLVAERICELRGDVDDAALKTCIQNLCPLVFKTRNSNIVPWIQSMPESELSDGQFERYLIDATVYLGLIELTSTLLEAQLSPASGTSELSARNTLHKRLKMAADRGNLDMIRIFLATESTFEKDGHISSHLCSIMLRHAAEGGHKDIFDFALDKCEPSGSSDRDSNRHWQAISAIAFPDNYERGVATFEFGLGVPQRSKVEGDDDLYYELCRSAYPGNFQMVRYFLDRGACLNNPKAKREVASLDRAGNLTDPAAMPLHTAINNSLPKLNPLKTAVQKNWPSLAQMLINYGANVNEGNPPPIVIAIEKENMEMFRLLRQKGAVLNTPETGLRAMTLAKSKGLVSMVTVLVDAGVEEVPTLPELEVKRMLYLTEDTLGWYMTSEIGKARSRYGEYWAEWSITKALENGNGFKIPRK